MGWYVTRSLWAFSHTGENARTYKRPPAALSLLAPGVTKAMRYGQIPRQCADWRRSPRFKPCLRNDAELPGGGAPIYSSAVWQFEGHT